MHYVYIAGLEHSGTTLLNQLLAQHPAVIGLGETAAFFSPAHMRYYLARWGDCGDARLCSCGQSWERCPFWAPLVETNGLHSAAPLWEKYRRLVQEIRTNQPEAQVVVDSSKSLPALQCLVDHAADIGLQRDRLLVLLAVKDVRCFATSIAGKAEGGTSWWACARTFNWWHGENRRWLDYLQGRQVRFRLVLYESLCADPQGQVRRIWRECGLAAAEDASTLRRQSHLVLGNKDFLSRNRGAVRYDSRWYLNDRVNLTYLLHRPARRFNRALYELDRAQATEAPSA